MSALKFLIKKFMSAIFEEKIADNFIRFRLDQNLPKSFILNQSLSWYCLLKIVLNPDSSAPSERAGVCREKDQMSIFL